MEFLKIIVLTVLLAIVYGIAHDMVTTRVCVEYFTVGHPDIFHTTSPTKLALGWGVVATWLPGLMIAVPLALVARFPFWSRGGWPKLTASELLPAAAVLMLLMGMASLIAGIVGYTLASRGIIGFPADDYLSGLPREKHAPFFADWYAHITAYQVGYVGGITLWVLVGYWRYKRSQALRAAAGTPAPGAPAPNP